MLSYMMNHKEKVKQWDSFWSDVTISPELWMFLSLSPPFILFGAFDFYEKSVGVAQLSEHGSTFCINHHYVSVDVRVTSSIASE